jgi:ribosomal protein L19
MVNKSYFYLDTIKEFRAKPEFYIQKRKNRSLIKNSLKFKKFKVGDIVEFIFYLKNMALIFSGICIAIKRKNFILPDVVLVLRNVIIKTSIEIIVSYFYNRAYKLKFLDYRRKFYTFNKNKLYFIRKRVNQESRLGVI